MWKVWRDIADMNPQGGNNKLASFLSWFALSRQIYAVPYSCCIVTLRSVGSVGGVFDPIVSSAIAVFEHVKDEFAVIPCLLLATL